MPKRIVKTVQLDPGGHSDVLKAIAQTQSDLEKAQAALRQVIEDFYPWLIGEDWTISSGGVVTVWGEVGDE